MPFSPSPANVRLLPGPVRACQDLNTRYLLELAPDRLLHTFHLQAGQPSSAEPLGGWEAPTCGLRGHFVGHCLSACAKAYASTRDPRLRERLDLLLTELAACQQPSGYLSAFPETDLDAMETTLAGAWAPYYTLHKILVGLLDAHEWANSATALTMATALADYVGWRLDRLTPEQLDAMCRTDLAPNPGNEVGGIGEGLRRLGQTVGEARYEELAQLFDREWFITPLLRREDRLTGLHCNAHIPMVLSLARRYELTGDSALRDAVIWFWERTALARSYVNGGSSGPHPDGTEKSKGAEHWPEPFRLANTLTPKINESCVTHNMLRLTDALFGWTGEPRYAEFYERAYLNHVLTMQHPDQPGAYLYDHPLGPGSHKAYGTPHDSFWCCYGTTVEAYARLAAGIYYQAADTVWVNLFVASEFTWPERGIRIVQETGFPDKPGTRLTVHCPQPTQFALSLRVPAWTEAAAASVNGDLLPIPRGDYLTIEREWHDGDAVVLRFGLRLSAEAMPDNSGMVAFRAGPLVLAALTADDLLLPQSSIADAITAIQCPAPGRYQIALADGSTVPLVPLHQVTTETFGVYFRLKVAQNARVSAVV
ncbi:MAG: hypothetical protein HN380_02810 [Victivallales bacterium]|nr:hypothetical protein [Victivallales bacterium]